MDVRKDLSVSCLQQAPTCVTFFLVVTWEGAANKKAKTQKAKVEK